MLGIKLKMIDGNAQNQKHVARKLKIWYLLRETCSQVPVYIFLFATAIRPIIDLAGRYENNSLNLGGIVSIFVAVTNIIYYLVNSKYTSKSFIPVLSFFSLIALCLLINILFSRTNLSHILVFSRYICGFSPLLIIPIFGSVKSANKKAMITFFYRLLLISSLFPIVIAWLQYLNFYDFTYFDFDYLTSSRVGRPSGGYWHPNSLGRLMIFDIILTYCIFLSGNVSLRNKNLMVMLLLVTTFISTHRTSLFASIVIILFIEVYILIMSFKDYKFLWRKTIVNLLTYLFGFFIISLLTTTNFLRLSRVIFMLPNSTFNLAEPSFFRGRGAIWQLIIDYMDRSPLINKFFGIGYEPFEAHNDFLRISMTTGIIGVFIHVFLFLYLFFWTWLRIDLHGKVVLCSLYIYILIYSVLLQPTSYPFFMWLFFAIHAFLLTCFHKSEKLVPKL